MGCFLGCFGGTKDSKCRKQRYKVITRDQKHVNQNLLQAGVTLEQGIKESPSFGSVSEFRGQAEEQLGLSTRKKVTFDSNVKTYEHIQVYDSTDSLLEKKEKEESFPKLTQPQSLSRSNSEDGSVISSAGSYPPNHRYQNCHESDDEIEDLEYEDDGDEDADFKDQEDYGDSDNDIDDQILCQEAWSESIPIPIPPMESRVEASSLETVGSNKNARDRSSYVHPVLNPVENLSQWKAVKSKGTPLPTNPQKENFSVNLSSQKPKNRNQEMAVDASLSNWLISSETTTPNKKVANYTDLETITSEKSFSQGSTTTSVKSIEDRPILGALTVDELKQFLASSTPRKSPSRSPDEIPIIGSVGSYWSHTSSVKDSSSTSSFKGIPNTTSKYREDKRVNWHSTPFETRLERALNRGAAEA